MQYTPEKLIEMVGESEDDEPTDLFLPPVDDLREDYEFYCTATSLTVNKEIEKQTNLLMIQQLGGLFNQMIQLLMLTNNPQAPLPEDVKQFTFGVLRSYFAMAEDLVRSFEKIDVSNYLPELPDVVKNAYGQAWHYLNYPQTFYFNLRSRYSEKEMDVVKELNPDTIIDDSLNLGDREMGEKAYIPFRNLLMAAQAAFYADIIITAGVADDVVSDKIRRYSVNSHLFYRS